MKKQLKAALSSGAVQWVLAFIIAAYALLVWYTARVRVQFEGDPNTYWQQDKPVIVALWHGRLLLMPFLFSGVRVQALISAHRDGLLVQKAGWFYSIQTVQGSSTRGGAGAFRALLRAAKNGETLFITPDGPKGPRHSVSKGTVELARQSGLPVFPVSISCRHGRRVNSWDNFLLPRLFSTVIVRWGVPHTLHRKADEAARETFRTQLAASLIRLEQQSDESARSYRLEEQSA